MNIDDKNISEYNSEQEIIYDNYRWNVLKSKRKRALDILSYLNEIRDTIFVIGSIARGDVKETSDIDLFILNPIEPYKIEYLLERKGISIYKKEIIQATPNYVPKVYIYIDNFYKEVISFPLSKLSNNELEFYYWGGHVTKNDLLDDKRVPGVNKELKMIIPTEKGHIEFPIFDREAEISRILKIKIETIMERERVLSKRKENGRTGVFLKYEIPFNESIDEAITQLSKKNQFFRKKILNYT